MEVVKILLVIDSSDDYCRELYFADDPRLTSKTMQFMKDMLLIVLYILVSAGDIALVAELATTRSTGVAK